jgi:hypothetical protein
MRRELYTEQNKSVKGRISKDSVAGSCESRGDGMLQKLTYGCIKSMKIDEASDRSYGFADVNRDGNMFSQPDQRQG